VLAMIVCKLGIAPKVEGRVPSRSLLATHNCVKADRRLMSSGMLPVKMLREKNKPSRLASPRMLSGIAMPSIKLFSKSRMITEVRLEIPVGIVDVNPFPNKPRRSAVKRVEISFGISPLTLLLAV
jgi:hypothetical protein